MANTYPIKKDIDKDERKKIEDFLLSEGASKRDISYLNHLLGSQSFMDGLNTEKAGILARSGIKSSEESNLKISYDLVTKNVIFTYTDSKKSIDIPFKTLNINVADRNENRSANERFIILGMEGPRGIINNIFLVAKYNENKLDDLIKKYENGNKNIDDLYLNLFSESIESGVLFDKMASNKSSPTEGIAEYLAEKWKINSDNEDLLLISRTLWSLHNINGNEPGDYKSFNTCVDDVKNTKIGDIPSDEPNSDEVNLLELVCLHSGFDREAGKVFRNYKLDMPEIEQNRRSRTATFDFLNSAIDNKLIRRNFEDATNLVNVFNALSDVERIVTNSSTEIRKNGSENVISEYASRNNVYYKQYETLVFANIFPEELFHDDKTKITIGEYFAKVNEFINRLEKDTWDDLGEKLQEDGQIFLSHDTVQVFEEEEEKREQDKERENIK